MLENDIPLLQTGETSMHQENSNAESEPPLLLVQNEPLIRGYLLCWVL